ncbi:hypothetical protein BC831DRAFT_469518 [Entophlyctis helioformis]|nr:hypothetical protein BC831DRAFT_469518 [Entophlyctis helioformis]
MKSLAEMRAAVLAGTTTQPQQPQPQQAAAQQAAQPAGMSDFVRESFRVLHQRANVDVDATKPLKLYFRSADVLWRQARIYESERNIVMAYLMYMRYTTLSITGLKSHPESKLPAMQPGLAKLRENARVAVEKMETIRPLLQQRFARLEMDNQAEIERKRRDRAVRAEVAVLSRPTTPTSASSATHGTIAVTAVSVTTAAGTAAGTADAEWWKTGGESASAAELRRQLERLATPSGSSSSSSSTGIVGPMIAPVAASYPSVAPPLPLPPQQSSGMYGSASIETPMHAPVAGYAASVSLPPPVPVKPSNALSALLGTGPNQPPDSPSAGSPTQAMIFEDTRPDGLRTLNLPRTLASTFLNIAAPNTRLNLETCGILCGTLSRSAFTVTTLLIPQQTATSDSCTTRNEELIFEVQDSRELLTLGWIHTHPSQSCFMSSVDLHTHCSYQIMMPEAIAIVMAPSKTPSQGIFRLTDPPGLDVISACRNPQMFHPHDGYAADDLYEPVSGGHVQLVDARFDVIDLRDKK